MHVCECWVILWNMRNLPEGILWKWELFSPSQQLPSTNISSTRGRALWALVCPWWNFGYLDHVQTLCGYAVHICCAHMLCTYAVKLWAQYSFRQQKTSCYSGSAHPLALISFASFQWCSLRLMGWYRCPIHGLALTATYGQYFDQSWVSTLTMVKSKKTFLWPWSRAGQVDRHQHTHSASRSTSNQSCGENNYANEVRINWIFDLWLFSSSRETISFCELM